MMNELTKTDPSAPTSQPPLALLPEHNPAQTRASKPKTRNGRVAHLPKLERDLVNHLLADAIPHNKIADALAKRGFKVTPRNISNWVTRGGYRQWCSDQALLTQTRLDQDTLTDFLRDDPTRLPEVGLQIIATRFSQTLLRSNLEPNQSFPLVTMLCRVSNAILQLHKFRDRRCSFGNPGYQFERAAKENKEQVETLRKICCGEPVEKEDPRKGLGQLLDMLRSRPEAAAALLTAQPAKSPASPAVLPADQSQHSNGNLKPATPLPKPARKPKSKTGALPPTPLAAPAQNENPTTQPGPESPKEIQNPTIENSPGPIEIQKSKIETESASLPVGEARGETNPVPEIKNQNSKIENSSTPSVVELTPLQTPLRFINNIPQPPPPQQCPKCHMPLEFFLDGSPPQLDCPKCRTPLANLYGSNIDRCPACNNPLPPLLPNGLRPSRVCAVCGCGLSIPKTPGPHPPPLRINARFCTFCHTPIPWASEGDRPGAYCAECHHALPRIVYKTGKPISARTGEEC